MTISLRSDAPLQLRVALDGTATVFRNINVHAWEMDNVEVVRYASATDENPVTLERVDGHPASGSDQYQITDFIRNSGFSISVGQPAPANGHLIVSNRIQAGQPFSFPQGEGYRAKTVEEALDRLAIVLARVAGEKAVEDGDFQLTPQQVEKLDSVEDGAQANQTAQEIKTALDGILQSGWELPSSTGLPDGVRWSVLTKVLEFVASDTDIAGFQVESDAGEVLATVAWDGPDGGDMIVGTGAGAPTGASLELSASTSFGDVRLKGQEVLFNAQRVRLDPFGSSPTFNLGGVLVEGFNALQTFPGASGSFFPADGTFPGNDIEGTLVWGGIGTRGQIPSQADMILGIPDAGGGLLESVSYWVRQGDDTVLQTQRMDEAIGKGSLIRIGTAVLAVTGNSVDSNGVLGGDISTLRSWPVVRVDAGGLFPAETSNFTVGVFRSAGGGASGGGGIEVGRLHSSASDTLDGAILPGIYTFDEHLDTWPTGAPLVSGGQLLVYRDEANAAHQVLRLYNVLGWWKRSRGASTWGAWEYTAPPALQAGVGSFPGRFGAVLAEESTRTADLEITGSPKTLSWTGQTTASSADITLKSRPREGDILWLRLTPTLNLTNASTTEEIESVSLWVPFHAILARRTWAVGVGTGWLSVASFPTQSNNVNNPPGILCLQARWILTTDDGTGTETTGEYISLRAVSVDPSGSAPSPSITISGTAPVLVSKAFPRAATQASVSDNFSTAEATPQGRMVKDAGFYNLLGADSPVIVGIGGSTTEGADVFPLEAGESVELTLPLNEAGQPYQAKRFQFVDVFYSQRINPYTHSSASASEIKKQAQDTFVKGSLSADWPGAFLHRQLETNDQNGNTQNKLTTFLKGTSSMVAFPDSRNSLGASLLGMSGYGYAAPWQDDIENNFKLLYHGASPLNVAQNSNFREFSVTEDPNNFKYLKVVDIPAIQTEFLAEAHGETRPGFGATLRRQGDAWAATSETGGYGMIAASENSGGWGVRLTRVSSSRMRVQRAGTGIPSAQLGGLKAIIGMRELPSALEAQGPEVLLESVNNPGAVVSTDAFVQYGNVVKMTRPLTEEDDDGLLVFDISISNSSSSDSTRPRVSVVVPAGAWRTSANHATLTDVKDTDGWAARAPLTDVNTTMRDFIFAKGADGRFGMSSRSGNFYLKRLKITYRPPYWKAPSRVPFDREEKEVRLSVDPNDYRFMELIGNYKRSGIDANWSKKMMRNGSSWSSEPEIIGPYNIYGAGNVLMRRVRPRVIGIKSFSHDSAFSLIDVVLHN